MQYDFDFELNTLASVHVWWILLASGKYDEIGSKSGHGGSGDREGLDANITMLEKEHEEITKVDLSFAVVNGELSLTVAATKAVNVAKWMMGEDLKGRRRADKNLSVASTAGKQRF